MTSLKDSKTRVTIGDSRTLTGEKCGNCRGYQRRDGKLHHVKLSNIAVIPVPYVNILSMVLAQKKGFQVTSEGETLILKKNSTYISFDEKMVNKGCEGFIPNKAPILHC